MGKLATVYESDADKPVPWYEDPALACERCGLYLECVCLGAGERRVGSFDWRRSACLLLPPLWAAIAWWEGVSG